MCAVTRAIRNFDIGAPRLVPRRGVCRLLDAVRRLAPREPGLSKPFAMPGFAAVLLAVHGTPGFCPSRLKRTLHALPAECSLAVR